jgi:hypothetical protein
VGGDDGHPALGGLQHQPRALRLVGERGDRGEDRRMVGEDRVAAQLARLAEHVVAQVEGDQQATHRLVVAAHDEADVVPLLGEGRRRQAIQRGDELGDEHRRAAGRGGRGRAYAAAATFSARCAGTGS